jgi:hypothetical protein
MATPAFSKEPARTATAENAALCTAGEAQIAAQTKSDILVMLSLGDTVD